jgi:ribosomal-protein-alanine N-acetyltransferase
VVRGQGLGKKILQALLDFCRGCGAHKVFLEVRAGNVVAQRLYARCGFVEAGLRRRYYADGEDAVLMRYDIVKTMIRR